MSVIGRFNTMFIYLFGDMITNYTISEFDVHGLKATGVQSNIVLLVNNSFGVIFIN